MGLFGSYDANIIGGSLLGIGMSLTGACPGTVLPQIATGVRSSLYVGIGGILGAMLFAKYVAKVVTRSEVSSLDTNSFNGLNDYEFLNLSNSVNYS